MLQTIAILALMSAAQDQPREDINEFTVGARVTIPGGSATSTYDWGDLLETGYGMDVQFSHLWAISPAAHAGIYASLSFDDFGGKDVQLGTVTVSPDPLVIYNIEGGGRIRGTSDNIFADANIGIGTAIYSKTNAQARGPGGSASIEVIQQSAEFMFTIGGRIGVMVSKKSSLSLGVHYQTNGAPKVGSGLTGFSFDRQDNAVFSFELNAGF